jgi:hypothetical protein
METFDQPKPIEFTNICIEHLKETRKWTMLLSVIGFIVIGLCIILLLIIFASTASGSFTGKGLVTTLPLLLLTLLYFSIYSKKAITNSDSQSLETALRYLKFHYRFLGIFVIVYIVIGMVALFSSMVR